MNKKPFAAVFALLFTLKCSQAIGCNARIQEDIHYSGYQRVNLVDDLHALDGYSAVEIFYPKAELPIFKQIVVNNVGCKATLYFSGTKIAENSVENLFPFLYVGLDKNSFVVDLPYANLASLQQVKPGQKIITFKIEGR